LVRSRSAICSDRHMKTIKNNESHHAEHTASVRSCGTLFEDRIRSLIKAACAARAGTALMTLNDWRELELEVKERLQNEHARIQR
jgi:hypothetical protein